MTGKVDLECMPVAIRDQTAENDFLIFRQFWLTVGGKKQPSVIIAVATGEVGLTDHISGSCSIDPAVVDTDIRVSPGNGQLQTFGSCFGTGVAPVAPTGIAVGKTIDCIRHRAAGQQ